MHKKYIILFLLIDTLSAAENKNFLLKLFVRGQAQTQVTKKEINWKEEATYFNTKVIPGIDTVLNTYKAKIDDNALSSIDIKALESILTYIDIGNQNFLKPRKSAKYEPIKAKTNRLRLAVYEYMYFNRSSDQKKVLNQIGNTNFSLTEENLKTISNIEYGHPYVFKSIDEGQIENKKKLDKKIEDLKKQSKKKLEDNSREYDQEIKKLEDEFKTLEEKLKDLKSKEPIPESFIKSDDTSKSLLREKSVKEDEKKLFEQKSLDLTEKMRMITELEKLIKEANIVNAGIYDEDNSIIFKNFTELIKTRDTLITKFNDQYNTFLNEFFPNESKSWKPLLKKVEELSSDAPAIIDRDNLQILKNKITSKKKELEATQQSLQQKISQLTTTIANLKAEASNAATIAQNQNEKAFEEAKKTFEKENVNILKEMSNREHKMNSHYTKKAYLSGISNQELSNTIEQLQSAFINNNIDIKEISNSFYKNIDNVSKIIEPWFTNLDQIATTVHMFERLPKIEWCYSVKNMPIPYNEQPKEPIIKSIKNFFTQKQASSSLEADICYLIIPNNDLLDFANCYKTAYIVISDLLNKFESLINDQGLSVNHQTIFNEAIVKQLLYKIKSIVNVFQNAFSTFYEKNNSQLKNLDVQISDKEAFSKLAKTIDQLIKQLSEDMSSINKKIDSTDKHMVNSIMEELIMLLKAEVTEIDIKYDLSFKKFASKEEDTKIISFAERKKSFFNEFKKLNRCIILIKLFNAFQYNWYTQSNDIAAKFETLCKKDVIDKLAIVLQKLDGGVQGIIDTQTKKIQNFDTETQNHDKIEWKEQIELHTSLLHDVYEYLTLYQLCIIPLIKNELFTNTDSIKKVRETTKKIAEQMNTIINTFQDNSMGYIFKPKYGSLIKYYNKLESLLQNPKEA